MNALRKLVAVALVFAIAPQAIAQSSSSYAVGDIFEIVRSYETKEHSSDGSSGSSSGSDTVWERVIALRDGGVEVEYSLGDDATSEDRARAWQFPARIFRPSTGSATLRNADEIETRLTRWLKNAGLDRSDCGRWIFTWNVFRIGCDPQAVVATVDIIDLTRFETRDPVYRTPLARTPVALSPLATETSGVTFAATVEIDPDIVRRERAEADVALGEITQQPVLLEDALARRMNERISGTTAITIETGDSGIPRKRTTITELAIEQPDGTTETRTIIEIIARRPVPR